jgi:predicted 3-demethylubiquinone-9 3-methyltransferase (glyoxalase superfamily)
MTTTTKNNYQKITPFLWFDDQAEAAVELYTSAFKNSGINMLTRYGKAASRVSGMPEGMVMTIGFHLGDQEFAAINAGPSLKLTPAISFLVNCNSEHETDSLWKKLSSGATIMMELTKYPFSDKFGWLQDRFGVNWQIIFAPGEQKITTSMMFTGIRNGKAEEAMAFYVSLFGNSVISNVERYKDEKQGGSPGTIMRADFTLHNQQFMAMDSSFPHKFNFTPAFSLVVNCDSQKEIDFFWEKLSDGGDKTAQQCGWLDDKYGVSWQIVPKVWTKMLQDSESEKSERLMQAVFQMKKINIDELERIYRES